MKTHFYAISAREVTVAINPVFEYRDYNDAFFLSQMDNQGESHLTVVIPAAAVAVAIWLAQGAVSYVGGTLMSKVLGHPSLSDVQNLIKNSIDELKNYIRDEVQRIIEENETTKMVASLNSIMRNLKQYDKFTDIEKPAYKFLLENAVIDAGNLMSLAEKKVGTVFIYANAASLRAIAFIALEKLSTHKKKTSIGAIDTLKEATEHVKSVDSYLKNTWSVINRLKPYEQWIERCFESPEVTLCYYYCKKDSQDFLFLSSKSHLPPSTVNDEYTKVVEFPVMQEYYNVSEHTLGPLYAIISSWKKIIN